MSGVFKDGAYYPLGCSEDMSEGEYQAYQGMCDGPPVGDEPEALEMPLGQWLMKDKRTLKIRKMTTTHLANAIKLFTKAGWGDHHKIEELRRALARR